MSNDAAFKVMFKVVLLFIVVWVVITVAANVYATVTKVSAAPTAQSACSLWSGTPRIFRCSDRELGVVCYVGDWSGGAVACVEVGR